ncbi:MAG: SH3 domain-containing protein [Candidatus Omnitrophica bacterium]|nr:SH3 domain-containing protein [Candidatus Omnitrophota bacterium]
MNLKSSLYLACLILLFSFNPALSKDGLPIEAEVNTDNINLRSDATANSPTVSTLKKGDKLEITAELYDWYKVRLPKNIPLYIKRALAKCINYKTILPEGVTDINTLPAEQIKKCCLSAIVTKDRVNVRLKPNELSPIVGNVKKNEVVNIRGGEGGWYKIEPLENCFGWIHKKFINKINTLPEQKPESKEEEITWFEGTINPYGVVYKRQGTHKFITMDKQIYLLRWDWATLNALTYQRVKIYGKIFKDAGEEYPVIEIKTIEVIN